MTATRLATTGFVTETRVNYLIMLSREEGDNGVLITLVPQNLILIRWHNTFEDYQMQPSRNQ